MLLKGATRIPRNMLPSFNSHIDFAVALIAHSRGSSFADETGLLIVIVPSMFAGVSDPFNPSRNDYDDAFVMWAASWTSAAGISIGVQRN
jgi:hypothetical protein